MVWAWEMVGATQRGETTWPARGGEGLGEHMVLAWEEEETGGGVSW